MTDRMRETDQNDPRPEDRRADSSAASKRPAEKSHRSLSPWSLLLGGGILAALVLGQYVWVVAILGLALLIPVHEFGHFIAAKSFGMRVEKFYIGFPPAAPAHVGRDRVRRRPHPAGRLLQDQRHDPGGGGARGHRRPRVLEEAGVAAQHRDLRRPVHELRHRGRHPLRVPDRAGRGHGEPDARPGRAGLAGRAIGLEAGDTLVGGDGSLGGVGRSPGLPPGAPERRVTLAWRPDGAPAGPTAPPR